MPCRRTSRSSTACSVRGSVRADGGGGPTYWSSPAEQALRYHARRGQRGGEFVDDLLAPVLERGRQARSKSLDLRRLELPGVCIAASTEASSVTSSCTNCAPMLSAAAVPRSVLRAPR